MQLQTIRTALAELQSDPEQSGAWRSLDDALTNGSGDRDEMLRLLVSARQEHSKRREWHAVARLLDAGQGRRQHLQRRQRLHRHRHLQERQMRERCHQDVQRARPMSRHRRLRFDDRRVLEPRKDWQLQRR